MAEVAGPLILPESLRWLRDEPDGAAWLAALPATLRACAERWSLALEGPFPGAYVAYVAPATTRTGERVVLKIQLPHRECAGEADALRRWAGRGYVTLLDHDRERYALLLERCEPGSSLAGADPAAIERLLVDLLRRSCVAVDRVRPDEALASIRDEAPRWVAELLAPAVPLAPDDAPLVALAVDTTAELLVDARGSVLVNLDLHRDNVLRARREPWLVIDPKALVGEPELALANRLPIFGAGEYDEGLVDAAGRVDRLCDALGLDRARARRWAFVRVVGWAVDSPAMRPIFFAVARALRDGW